MMNSKVNKTGSINSGRLRVVQILPALNVGGVERGTLEVAKELVRRGHRSIVISAGGRLVDELVNSGSEHVQLNVGKKSLFTLRHVSLLRKFFRDEKINVVHARSRLPAWLAYLALKKMEESCRPKFVTTVHGPYSVNRYSEIMTRGQNVIATSGYIQKYITDNYPHVAENKITLIHRGVSKKQFPFAYKPDNQWLHAWQQQQPALANKFILTMPARVTRWKGHEDFLAVLAQLKQEGLPIHGLVAGGPHRRKTAYLEELKAKSRSLGLEDDITFLGHRNDIREIMSISNIVLSLAKTPEAFGRTALEALCLGTPVVAYNHGGAAEVLDKMYPYGCVAPNDTKAVYEKIVSFYQQPVAVKDENFFTLDKMLNDTLSVYAANS